MISIVKSTQQLYEIAEYATENGFEVPYSSILIEARRDNKIIGVIGIDKPTVIEPLITKSPFVANELYNVALGIILGSGVDRIECFTTDEQYKKIGHLFERKGFNFLEKTNRFVKLLK